MCLERPMGRAWRARAPGRTLVWHPREGKGGGADVVDPRVWWGSTCVHQV